MDRLSIPKIDPKTRQSAEAAIRATLAEALKKCPKRRSQIAEELTALTGMQVSEGMLNDWCSVSKKGLRFPLSLTRAVCEVTGNDDLAFSAMRDSLREHAELGKALHPFLKKWDENRRVKSRAKQPRKKGASR